MPAVAVHLASLDDFTIVSLWAGSPLGILLACQYGDGTTLVHQMSDKFGTLALTL
jgi:hypothetical protein